MNNLKKTLIILLLLITSFSLSRAQSHYLDTIRVQIDDKMEIHLASFDFSVLKDKLDEDFTTLSLMVDKSSHAFQNLPFLMSYVPGNSLSVTPSEPVEKIVMDSDRLHRFYFNNKLIVSSDAYHMQIRFNDLEDLFADRLIVRLKEVIDSTLHIQGRCAKTYNYSFNENELIHNKHVDTRNGFSDVLILNIGTGVSFIQNQPVNDLSILIGPMLIKRGVAKNHYYISNNLMFDFNENKSINHNNFLNVGYRRNLSWRPDKSFWLGMELGYLTHRNGSFFDKNTLKLGVNWEVGKFINVSPQIFTNTSFSKVYPAVRIGIGL